MEATSSQENENGAKLGKMLHRWKKSGRRFGKQQMKRLG
jgi:hypothetical protein